MKILEVDQNAKTAYCELKPGMCIDLPKEMLKQYGVAWSKVKVGAVLTTGAYRGPK